MGPWCIHFTAHGFSWCIQVLASIGAYKILLSVIYSFHFFKKNNYTHITLYLQDFYDDFFLTFIHFSYIKEFMRGSTAPIILIFFAEYQEEKDKSTKTQMLGAHSDELF